MLGAQVHREFVRRAGDDIETLCPYFAARPRLGYDEVEENVARGYSTFAPDTFTSLPHFSCSARKYTASSSGVLVTILKPCALILPRAPGSGMTRSRRMSHAVTQPSRPTPSRAC